MKIFQLPTDQLKVFAKEAKKYGVLFVAMVDKHNPAPDTDIMVFSRDAAKINRILDRLSFAVVDIGAIESEIQNERVDNDPFVHRSDVPFATSSPISSDSQSLPETEEGGRRSVKSCWRHSRSRIKSPSSKADRISNRRSRTSAPSARKRASPRRKHGDGYETISCALHAIRAGIAHKRPESLSHGLAQGKAGRDSRQ